MIDASLPIHILYQSIGMIAMLLSFFSFQTRNNKVFLVLQSFSCALFAVQFSITQAWVACIMNIVCVLRGIFYSTNKNKKANIIVTILFVCVFLAIAIMSVPVFKEVWYIALLCCSASIFSTIAISTNNNLFLQHVQLTYVSPCWIINAIYYFSIGAIISESLNIISVIITLTRRYIEYQKRKKNESKAIS